MPASSTAARRQVSARDEVHHGRECVGAVESGARTADDLDAVEIVEEVLLQAEPAARDERIEPLPVEQQQDVLTGVEPVAEGHVLVQRLADAPVAAVFVVVTKIVEQVREVSVAALPNLGVSDDVD